MTQTLTINGRNIRDVASFYAEINRVFMADEKWTLGESLDALDDLLYGNYGVIVGREPITLVWQDIESSKSALGLDATRMFLTEKLQRPDIFDARTIRCQLDALEQGTGKTYFDIVIEIIASHSNIERIGR